MTEKELNTGKELLQKIKYLEVQKGYWDSSFGFSVIRIKHRRYTGAETGVVPDFIDFESVKTQVLNTLSEEIKKLKIEFDNL